MIVNRLSLIQSKNCRFYNCDMNNRKYESLIEEAKLFITKEELEQTIMRIIIAELLSFIRAPYGGVWSSVSVWLIENKTIWRSQSDQICDLLAAGHRGERHLSLGTPSSNINVHNIQLNRSELISSGILWLSQSLKECSANTKSSYSCLLIVLMTSISNYKLSLLWML